MATSIKMSDSLKARGQRFASQRGQMPQCNMRDTINQSVEREEARETFRREALTSWVSYKATSRHLTAGEIDNWLNNWGTDKERPVPNCHK